MVSKPYDQMVCGSNWAFSAASALESLAMIKEVDKTVSDFSMKQILDCDNQNYGCSGGWVKNAFQYTSLDGIMLSSHYNVHYDAKQGECFYNPMLAHFRNEGY